jgi:hypothetical protein
MGQAKEPLIVISGYDDWRQSSRSNRFIKSSFALTEIGREVLVGRSDFIGVNSVDLWLGGAHLTADNLWRWDEPNRKLIRDWVWQSSANVPPLVDRKTFCRNRKNLDAILIP